MSNPNRPVMAGQVVTFEKPSGYWLRRAEHHRKRGEHHRAAALLRRAVSLEPSSGELRLQYAQTLRDLSCFEASTREAFGALALEPAGFLPYGLISRNMLSLGREQEAVDAFTHYLQQSRSFPEVDLLWEAEEYLDLENLLGNPPSRGYARYEALIHISSRQLANGKLDRAAITLSKASRIGRADARLHALYAMLYQAAGRLKRAAAHASLSAHKSPRHVASLCALASVRLQMGKRSLAATAMLAAAFNCHYPHEEQLFCFTASALNLPELMLAMLRHNKHGQPDRLPTLFNLAVVLLRLGKPDAALVHLHRCRDLDPDDVTVQFVFHTAEEWAERGLPVENQQKEAAQLPFYPHLSPTGEERLLEAIAEKLGGGLPSFVDALHKDGLFYRQFLYALSLTSEGLSNLLSPISLMMADHCPLEAERLLRDVLLQNTQDPDVKRYALSALVSLDAKPPYIIWQNRRIMQVNPIEAHPKVPTMMQRLLAHRILVACRKLRNPRVAGHAFQLLWRMDRRQRYAFAADAKHSWQRALMRHFLQYHGLRPSLLPFDASSDIPAALKAFSCLCRLWPLPKRSDHNETR
ncbi:MAG: tetratricopeptide repeat protein [Clostridia bacterium]|nr:tetratricopeptide repeat protein [Clostridia bacterium]